jgi:hypothetical protein
MKKNRLMNYLSEDSKGLEKLEIYNKETLEVTKET